MSECAHVRSANPRHEGRCAKCNAEFDPSSVVVQEWAPAPATASVYTARGASTGMSINEIREVLSLVEYRDWTFHVFDDGEGTRRPRPVLRVAFNAPCHFTGVEAVQYGRKWFLSPHMTRSEIVSTALKAVLTAIEHEAREEFTYRGVPVFGPHFNVERLAELANVAQEVRA